MNRRIPLYRRMVRLRAWYAVHENAKPVLGPVLHNLLVEAYWRCLEASEIQTGRSAGEPRRCN